jgi:BASS family bile acid:Na+ symporter
LSLSKTSFILTAGFPVWSLVVSALALYQPATFLWYGGEAITWGLGVIMLGMGVTLEPKDFTQVFKSPKIIFLGVALQY